MAERKVRKTAGKTAANTTKRTATKTTAKTAAKRTTRTKGCSKGRFPYRRTGSVSVQYGNAL